MTRLDWPIVRAVLDRISVVLGVAFWVAVIVMAYR